jgi:hypothetical protein
MRSKHSMCHIKALQLYRVFSMPSCCCSLLLLLLVNDA